MQHLQDFIKLIMFLLFALQVTLDRLWKVVYNELGGCPGSTSAATCTRRHYERWEADHPPPLPSKSPSFRCVIDAPLRPRLMLPYEEHLRTGGAEFKIPECPSPPKARGIRGRKPLPRGRKAGAKAKEKRITTPAASPPAVSAGKCLLFLWLKEFCFQTRARNAEG